MQIQTDVSLKNYSTMRLGGLAKHLVHVKTEAELIQALDWADENHLHAVAIGGGSNIYWSDEGYDGLVIVNEIKGYAEDPHDGAVFVTAGAGEVWDEVVERTVKSGLSGIEALSLIPGSVGATPVQNVGAYGQEISHTLVHVRAYDRTAKQMVTLATKDCALAYRTSRFKVADHGRFFITSITMRLTKGEPKGPFYPGLQRYLDEQHISNPSVATIREAVIAIRTAKLPDPKKVANNGSFFANPVVTQAKLDELQTTHPDIPFWPVGTDKFKLPAAWIVQEAGFKGVHDPETGMGTWPHQALVLVNEHARSTADLMRFRQKILDAAFQQFGIVLEQEPQML